MITRKDAFLIAGGVALGAALSLAASLVRRGPRGAGGDEEVAAPSRVRVVRGPLGEEAAIALDGPTQAQAGIETRVLGAASGAETMTLTGELAAEPGRIVVVRAAVAGRVRAAGDRWPRLGDRIAAGTVLAQVSDAEPLTAPRTGTVTQVSAQPGEMVQAGQELFELTDFREMLARIAWRPGAPRTPPGAIALSPLGTPSLSARASLIGPAADVDSLTRAPVNLYRVGSPWPGARPGAPVVATLALAGASDHGVLVPAGAVVQWAGLTWAYVRHGGAGGTGLFLRRRVDTGHPAPGGWLVLAGDASEVRAGDTVVVRGAQILLSEEFRSRAGGAESDEGER